MLNSTSFHKRELKDSFKQEALKSWEDYQKTGLYLSGQETRNWLATWDTGKEIKVSQCHK
jgi:predicted transcriptional regulator